MLRNGLFQQCHSYYNKRANLEIEKLKQANRHALLASIALGTAGGLLFAAGMSALIIFGATTFTVPIIAIFSICVLAVSALVGWGIIGWPAYDLLWKRKRKSLNKEFPELQKLVEWKADDRLTKEALRAAKAIILAKEEPEKIHEDKMISFDEGSKSVLFTQKNKLRKALIDNKYIGTERQKKRYNFHSRIAQEKKEGLFGRELTEHEGKSFDKLKSEYVALIRK